MAHKKDYKGSMYHHRKAPRKSKTQDGVTTHPDGGDMVTDGQCAGYSGGKPSSTKASGKVKGAKAKNVPKGEHHTY